MGESKSACRLRFSLVLGKMHNHSEANEKWKDQISIFQQDKEYTELFGIDGQPIEFEWKGRILFTPMFNDIDWTKRDHAKRFQRGHWLFYGTYSRKAEGKWDNETNQMIEQFQ